MVAKARGDLFKFSVAVIYHRVFVIRSYKTDQTHSSYGHSRQLEQKVSKNTGHKYSSPKNEFTCNAIEFG